VALLKRRRVYKKFTPPKLMLTSMMDMFTIILIFLLFSFSEEPEKLKIGKDLELPRSTAEVGYQKALKIILTKSELRINDEVMAQVKDHRVIGLKPEELEASAFFQRLKGARADVAPEGKKERETTHVLFLCDKSHSFKTINNVIKTAGLAGYPNFQFGVLEEKN
jgi:biopolymer transport protein ExbD